MRKVFALIAIGTLCFGCQHQMTEPDLGRQLQSILGTEVQDNDAMRSAALHDLAREAIKLVAEARAE